MLGRGSTEEEMRARIIVVKTHSILVSQSLCFCLSHLHLSWSGVIEPECICQKEAAALEKRTAIPQSNKEAVPASQYDNSGNMRDRTSFFLGLLFSRSVLEGAGL